MTFDRFTIKVILRVLLLLANLSLFSFFIWSHYNLFFSYLLLLVLLILQVGELIYFLNKTHRELNKFLEAILYEDYAISFPQNKDQKSFTALNKSMAAIIEKLKNHKAQEESHHELLQMVLHHVKLGVIVVAPNKEIILMNAAAQNLLEIPDFKDWGMLQKKKAAFANHLGDFNFHGRKLIQVGHQEFYLDLDHITLLEKNYHLISFSDVKNEIEQKEIEAWHKLIRILAHEVMNSVTPISSLSETVYQLLSTPEQEAIDLKNLHTETIDDVREALQTIVKRSRGMLGFVEEYRKLTQLPAPHFETIEIKELIENIFKLMKAEVQQKGIALNLTLKQNKLSLKADRKMIEQVLINLISNAFHALEETKNPEVHIEAKITEDFILIEISDNGKGIAEEILPSVFIPFFSTRKNGSGIGLTLTKNIMKLHRGNIRVASKENVGTTFSLSFPNH